MTRNEQPHAPSQPCTPALTPPPLTYPHTSLYPALPHHVPPDTLQLTLCTHSPTLQPNTPLSTFTHPPPNCSTVCPPTHPPPHCALVWCSLLLHMPHPEGPSCLAESSPHPSSPLRMLCSIFMLWCQNFFATQGVVGVYTYGLHIELACLSLFNHV